MLQVRRAGYTSRKLLLLVSNQKLSEIDDCGTDNYLIINIQDEDFLERFHGRWYLDGDGLSAISRNEKSLIGKTLSIRTPITCSLKDGHICKTCYGKLHVTNPFHIGISNVLSLTEQLTQRLLSSKHLLQINPEKIVLHSNLADYFYLENKEELIAKKQFRLVINPRNINISENDEYTISKFSILDADIAIDIELPEGNELLLDFIIDDINIHLDENIIEIYEEAEVFKVYIDNIELITPLKKIIATLESDDNLAEYPYPILLSQFLELLGQSGIKSASLTIELILRELLRNRFDIQERPSDFSNFKNIIALKLTNALVHHPSLAITLAFERMNYVLENNMFSKNQASIFDALF